MILPLYPHYKCIKIPRLYHKLLWYPPTAILSVPQFFSQWSQHISTTITEYFHLPAGFYLSLIICSRWSNQTKNDSTIPCGFPISISCRYPQKKHATKKNHPRNRKKSTKKSFFSCFFSERKPADMLCFWDHLNGHFRNLNWRYLPYVRP